jgi:hypothetical protein
MSIDGVADHAAFAPARGRRFRTRLSPAPHANQPDPRTLPGHSAENSLLLVIHCSAASRPFCLSRSRNGKDVSSMLS